MSKNSIYSLENIFPKNVSDMYYSTPTAKLYGEKNFAEECNQIDFVTDNPFGKGNILCIDKLLIFLKVNIELFSNFNLFSTRFIIRKERH